MPSSLKIKPNIQMPEYKSRGAGGGPGKQPKYPWRDMAVGDSFLFPEEVGRGSYAAAFQASKSITGKKFRVLKVKEGWRCWRVK